jgi:hypothetical protein
MSITFHDGTLALYSKYCDGKAWNDASLLRLNTERSQYDKYLMEKCNTETAMKALLGGDAVRLVKPVSTGSKLGEYMDAKATGIIVIKGLHQWERIGTTWNYHLHITFGLDGYLWHLYALYENHTEKVRLLGEISRGESLTTEDHEGFKQPGKGGKAKK